MPWADPARKSQWMLERGPRRVAFKGFDVGRRRHSLRRQAKREDRCSKRLQPVKVVEEASDAAATSPEPQEQADGNFDGHATQAMRGLLAASVGPTAETRAAMAEADPTSPWQPTSAPEMEALFLMIPPMAEAVRKPAFLV